MMKIKTLYIAVLCTGLLVGCDKENDYELIKPPIENPEEPEHPDKPTTQPSTNDITNLRIGGIDMIVGSNKWNRIAYGNGKYVVTGGSNATGYVAYSTDGANWSSKQISSRGLYTIAYGNGIFIAIGDGGSVGYSADGINWTVTKTNNTENYYGIAYGNGIFVAVSYNTGYFSISTNGHTWSSYKGVYYLKDIVFANSVFVAISENGTACTSADGKNWSIYNGAIADVSYNMQAITFGNGKFVAIGKNGYVATSTDGTIWDNKKVINSTITWNDIICHNGIFIAVGGNGYVTTSTDGVTWTTPEQIKDESGNPVTAQLNSVYAIP